MLIKLLMKAVPISTQARGVLVKTPHFQWTIMASIYDIFDIGGTWLHTQLLILMHH